MNDTKLKAASWLLSWAIALLALCPIVVSAQDKPPELKIRARTLNNDFKPLSGDWAYDSRTISIGGIVFDACASPVHSSSATDFTPYVLGSESNFATFDVRGWDRFQAKIGVDDGWEPRYGVGTLSIEVDGKQVWRQTVRRCEKYINFKAPISRSAFCASQSSSPICSFWMLSLKKGGKNDEAREFREDGSAQIAVLTYRSS